MMCLIIILGIPTLLAIKLLLFVFDWQDVKMLCNRIARKLKSFFDS